MPNIFSIGDRSVGLSISCLSLAGCTTRLGTSGFLGSPIRDGFGGAFFYGSCLFSYLVVVSGLGRFGCCLLFFSSF